VLINRLVPAVEPRELTSWRSVPKT